MGDVSIRDIEALLSVKRAALDAYDVLERQRDALNVNRLRAEISHLQQQLATELARGEPLDREMQGAAPAQQVRTGHAPVDATKGSNRPTILRNLKHRFRQQGEQDLHRPPGYGLLWLADFFYSRKSVEEYLRPTIQDLQEEYVEALAAKRPHKARWVRIRGTWSFVCAAGLLTMASVVKQVVKIWRAVG